MAHNTSAYDNHLTLREIAKKITWSKITRKFRNCAFLCVAQNCEKFIFSAVRKFIDKVNNKGQNLQQSLFGEIY